MAKALVETNMTTLGHSGIYSAFNGLWGAIIPEELLTFGFNCQSGARYDTASLNQNVVFGWQVPATLPITVGVRGYLGIQAWNYDDSSPTVPLVPKKVSQITTLQTVCGFQQVGSPTGILHEHWLTSTPHATGSLSDKTDEVGTYLTSPAQVRNFMDSESSPVGSGYTDAMGRSWIVAKKNAFCTRRPTDNSDVQGTVLWTDFHTYLLAHGAINDNYLNGLAMGVEPLVGKGAASLSMTATYA